MDETRVDAFLDLRCGDDLTIKQSVLKLLDRDRDLETSAFLEQSPNALPIPKTDHATLCGTRLGLWDLTRHLGSGGMGDVYLGKRTEEFEQLAAIKVVRASANGEKIARRFRKEMQFLASLGKHPRITSILDAGTTESGQPYIAMEYVDGQRINDYCNTNRLDIRSRLQLFCKACDAVQFAHQNAVLHRDIKPSNLLVTESGQPMLIDFGVAKLTADESNHAYDASQTQHQPFSPGYASPELLKGQPATTAGDVYALGVILYELLSGHLPHSLYGRSIAETVRLVCDTDPGKPSSAATKAVEVRCSDLANEMSTTVVSPQQLAEFRGLTTNRLQSELSGDLDRIVMKAVDRDVDQRYATVEQLSADIKRFLSGHPVKAQPSSFGYRAKKYIRRNAWGVAAAAAFVLLLVGSVVVTSRLAYVASQSAKAEREQRLLASEAADAEREQRLRANQLAEAERQQRLLAEKRESTANEIVKLFDEFLASANPAISGRPDYTTRELIEQFAEDLESKPVNDPVVEARLLQSVASACIGSGDYNTARTKFERAIELFRENLGPSHIETATALLRSVDYYLLMSGPDLAKKASHELIGIVKSVDAQGLSTRDPRWDEIAFSAWVGMAASETDLRNYKEALGAIEKAEAHAKRLEPEAYEKAALTLKRHRNYLFLIQGKIEEAMPFTEEEYHRACDEYGEDDPRVTRSANHLAIVYRKQSRFHDAAQLYNKMLINFQKRLGRNHPETLVHVMNTASANFLAGNFEAADAFFSDYEDIHVKLKRYEGNHYHATILDWAKCLTELGKYDEAERVIKRCLRYASVTNSFREKAGTIVERQLADLIKKSGPVDLADAWDEAPGQPQCLNPIGNLIVETSGEVTLVSSKFRHATSAMDHYATRWQIRAEDESYQHAPTFDVTTTDHFESLTVPTGILLPNKTYFWRVAHMGRNLLVSEFSAEQAIETKDLDYRMRPIDLTAYFNRDVVRNEGDTEEGRFVGNLQLAVDSGDEIHGLPVNRIIGPHCLASYSDANAIQLSRDSGSARVDVPADNYSGLRVLIAAAPQGYRRGDLFLDVTLDYADGSTSKHKVHCPKYKADVLSNYPQRGLQPTNMVRKEIREVRKDGTVVRSKETALSDLQIPVDGDRKLRAILIHAGKAALPNNQSRVNILAITGVAQKM